jgi:hypothetical protein
MAVMGWLTDTMVQVLTSIMALSICASYDYLTMQGDSDTMDDTSG